MTKVIPIILVSLLFTGCSGSALQNKMSQTTSSVMESKQITSTEAKDTKLSIGDVDKPLPKIESSEKDDAGAKSETEAAKTVTKVKPEYQKYADFLGVTEDLASFIKEDIDLDGKQEIVIAFGTDFIDTFVLREDGTKLTLIGEIKGDGYNTCDVKLVSLQGLEQKYILAQVTNGANLYGFALYKIHNDELEQIAYSASATGSGDDSLRDTDKDGKYDGYVQNRRSYDVMYFPTTRFYKLKGEDFVLENSHMELGDYPETPEEVVEQYLQLSIVHEEKCQEFDSRFKELSNSDKVLNIDGNESWHMAIQIQAVNLKTDGEGDNVKVTSAIEEDNIVFTLCRKDNKWQIIDIAGSSVLERM